MTSAIALAAIIGVWAWTLRLLWQHRSGAVGMVWFALIVTVYCAKSVSV